MATRPKRTERYSVIGLLAKNHPMGQQHLLCARKFTMAILADLHGIIKKMKRGQPALNANEIEVGKQKEPSRGAIWVLDGRRVLMPAVRVTRTNQPTTAFCCRPSFHPGSENTFLMALTRSAGKRFKNSVASAMRFESASFSETIWRITPQASASSPANSVCRLA